MSILDWVKFLKCKWDNWICLTKQELENFSMFCQEEKLDKWEVLFREWEDANSMYFVKQWSIKVSKEVNWKEIVLGRVGDDEVLWEMALFWPVQSRMATATALEDTKLIVILSFSLKEMTTKYPHILKKIQQLIQERIIANKSRK